MGRQESALARRRRHLVLAGGGSLAAIAAGVWFWLGPPSVADVEHLAAAHRTDAAWRAAADVLEHTPGDQDVLRAIDTLWGALCDPTTGEPIPPRDPAPLRRVVLVLHHAVDAGQDTPLADQVLGEVALAAGYTPLAAEALRHAEARQAADRLLRPLALALLYSGRYQDVLQSIRPDAASPDLRAALLIVRARAELALAQTENARSTLHAALAIDAANIDALSRLGMLALWQDRNTAAAAALLDRARRIAPDASPTLRLAGEYDYATGDHAGSATAYGVLVRRHVPETFDPTPPSLGEARALIYAGDVARAKSVLDAAALRTGDPSLRYYRALLAFRGGMFKQAAELGESLNVTMPHYPPLDLLMGGAMLASGLTATAAAHLAHYVAEVPSDDAARRLLAAAVQGHTVPASELLADFGFPPIRASSSGGRDGS